MRPRARPFGEAALLVETDPRSRHATAAALSAAARADVVDVVPAERSVLVAFEPGVDVDSATRWAERVLADVDDAPGPDAGELVLAVDYDGPDLADVARLVGLTPPEVVAQHVAATHVVAFLGFVPGFAYLDGLPDSLRVPRLTTPRTRVEPGSVAIADARTCVYPRATPGGWRVIGHTDVELFDPARQPPTPLAAGRRVRFVES